MSSDSVQVFKQSQKTYHHVIILLSAKISSTELWSHSRKILCKLLKLDKNSNFIPLATFLDSNKKKLQQFQQNPSSSHQANKHLLHTAVAFHVKPTRIRRSFSNAAKSDEWTRKKLLIYVLIPLLGLFLSFICIV